MIGPTLFDAVRSEAEKQYGIQTASINRRELLELARVFAVGLALSRESREVSADDVVRAMVEAGHSAHCLGNSSGALFKSKCWRWTGKFVKSARVHSHSNLLRVWLYIGDSQ